MIIGITGGIGSGKSTVARIIAEISGAKLIFTDDIARELMEPGNLNYINVVNNFGKDILCADNTIDRQKLAGIVFKNKDKLSLLNRCTHPAVIETTKHLIEEYSKNNKIIIIESALLNEAGMDVICDKVWYVFSNIDVRKRRLKNDRGYSDNRIDDVIKKQNHPIYIEDIKKMYDRIIINNDNMEQLNKNIKQIVISEFGLI